jgi:hypothetical protein
MRDYGVMVVAGLAWFAVEYRYGPIGGTRLFGTFIVLWAIWSIREPSLTISLGQYPVGSVSGWKKAFVLVPAAAVGLALLAYAPEITCLSSRYSHLCR